MDRENYYKRIKDIFHPEKLESKKAIIIGLGSGGARVAIEFGRTGVELVLIDLPDERLEESNIVRHPCGYDSLGKRKSRAVAAYIKNLNPFTKVTHVDLDVSVEKEKLSDLLARVKPQVIMVCVDNEPAKHSINEIAVRFGITQIGAGVYDAGIGGEVTIARPTSTCYGCIAQHLQLARQAPGTRRTIDYNNLDAAAIRSTCALNLDIEQIALIQARMGLHILLEGEPDLTGIPDAVNLCVFCNRPVPDNPALARPLHGEFFSIPRDPDCLVCGTFSQGVNEEAERILNSLETAKKPQTSKINRA